MRPSLSYIALYSLFMTFPVTLPAQQKQTPPPTAPPAAAAPGTAADAGTYDPVSAEEDVNVGNFYMRKGDIDAAISRFKDAIRMRSTFAKPRLLLGDAYERKGDKTNAVKYYKEYLQVSPHAPDANKIQKKIEKLSTE